MQGLKGRLMKRRTKVLLSVCAVLILTAGIFISAVEINARILAKNINTVNVCVPKGLADKYWDYMFYSFDDHRIWEYSLNAEEAAAVEAELNNGKWKKPTKEEYDTIISVFFTIYPDSIKPEKMTDNVFYCLYNDLSGEFVEIKSEIPLRGAKSPLFVYDVTQKTYWCVAKEI